MNSSSTEHGRGNRWRLQVILLVGTFAGSWASIFGRIAQEEGVPTFILIAFRMTLGFLVLTPFVLRWHQDALKKLSRRDVLVAGAAGFWMATHLVLGFSGLEHTSVLVNGVLGGTLPLWVALLETYVLKTRLNAVIWIGLFLTLGGGVVITLSGSGDLSLGDNPLLGSILSASAAVAGAIYAIIGRGSRERMPFLPYLWMVFIAGSITTLILSGVARYSFTGYSSTAYFALIMLTILPQLIGHSAYNYVLRKLPATYSSVVGQIGIVISAVLAYFLFNEIPHALQLPGSLLILGGITLVNLSSRQPSRNASGQAEAEVIRHAGPGLHWRNILGQHHRH
ncbi:MAG: DMT family transporter [Anaerolineae bacterium]|nr:DMT family transporter [Anaerolineae bacterium]